MSIRERAMILTGMAFPLGSILGVIAVVLCVEMKSLLIGEGASEVQEMLIGRSLGLQV